MENRSLSVVAGLIALWAAAPAALAADAVGSPEQLTAWQQRLDKADALKAEGQAKQEEADRRLREQDEACQKKVLVNDCRNQARKAHLATTREARHLELEGKDLARQVKAEQVAERQRRQEADAPRRAAELQARQEQTAAARQAAEDKAAATRADKAQKAVEGQRRKAAEAEKLRRKQAEHEARVAAKMEKAARRKAKAAAGD